MNILKKLRREPEPMWTLDAQGNLRFPSRDRSVRDACAPDSIWERPWVSILVLIVCALLDFVVAVSVINDLATDRLWVRLITPVGYLIGFDLAPVYLGNFIRKREQRLGVSAAGRLFAVAFAGAFLATFLLNAGIRLGLIGVNGMDLGMSGAVYADSAAQARAEAAQSAELTRDTLYQWTMIVLPAVTSLVSFGVSYYVNDFLRLRLNRAMLRRARLEDEYDRFDAVLAEYASLETHSAELQEDDDMQYAAARAQTREVMLHWCDYVRERIKEHLGDAAAANELSKDRRAELGALAQLLEAPENFVTLPAAEQDALPARSIA